MIRYLVSIQNTGDIYPTLLETYLDRKEAIAHWESLLGKYPEVYLSSEHWNAKESAEPLEKLYLN